jgi:hypothetical protein
MSLTGATVARLVAELADDGINEMMMVCTGMQLNCLMMWCQN